MEHSTDATTTTIHIKRETDIRPINSDSPHA
jgi:hypothetical protein